MNELQANDINIRLNAVTWIGCTKYVKCLKTNVITAMLLIG